jgi:hypothetical protein
MASLRDLKRDINYVLGDIIEAVYIWENENNAKGSKAGEEIIDEAIATFDVLIAKVNDKSIENRKQHLKAVNKALEEKGRVLIEKINNL